MISLWLVGWRPVGYVCYQASPLLAIGLGGMLLIFTGINRAVVARRTDKGKIMIADIFAASITGAALGVDLTHPRDPSLARSFGLTRSNIAGVQVTEDSALGLASFWRGCNIIANGVAKPPATIRRVTSKGSQDAKEHQHFHLVNSRANEFNSACDLRRTLQLHALIWGNGIAKLNRVGNRAVEAIPLLPDRTGMAVVSTGKNKIVEPSKIDRASESTTIKYVTRIGNDPIVIDPADVIHIRGLSYNGLWGFPVVETLADAIGAAIAPRDYGAKMFAQGPCRAEYYLCRLDWTSSSRSDLWRPYMRGALG